MAALVSAAPRYEFLYVCVCVCLALAGWGGCRECGRVRVMVLWDWCQALGFVQQTMKSFRWNTSTARLTHVHSEDVWPDMLLQGM